MSQDYKSYVKKVIFNFRATDHFFINCEYFFIYSDFYHKFQTGSRKILRAHEYGDIILHLA